MQFFAQHPTILPAAAVTIAVMLVSAVAVIAFTSRENV
jgi:hypothetical protein